MFFGGGAGWWDAGWWLYLWFQEQWLVTTVIKYKQEEKEEFFKVKRPCSLVITFLKEIKKHLPQHV